ncbi:DNA polymerase III subunit beta [Propionicimonas sp.]|uniref:DNA polymerase III subunit beta n=1 Tax=Propionicimonas sp. TaxID=1955623 RepID=UPI0017942999|nr:DNA polymerase III subunit beta [Propionicimonas sp.]MBU3976339.1 DNA polymerase III subunit beta [Actinomycetota bacterium]MBA3022068.1 DNA polymerase III subunit beta [Propionicimonas sp.]MBU3987496.1 DNA polymerase III subunit beta [Actinomycetota bacterium]MBU4006559.1 DNA polymerase III subunit beta [Actinomycetota bacterium]MBU4065164.1 DNA polymerase III subunit beta [Actinomycetota bacterium]
MKIRLERDVLAEAVQWAARSLPTRPSVPILAGLLVKAVGNQVVMSSFDYETSAQITVPAQVSDEGVALVSGRLLADIARSLPNKTVEITADETRMELVCGTARFTLQTLPVADYPSLPEMPEATGVIPSEEFARAVSQVVVAAGRDELLPVFTGVRMEIENNTLSLLATDRYRMALKELDWNPGGNAEGAALVPARVLAETAKSMTSGESVTLSLASAASGDGLIGFEGTGAAGVRQITTRLLDGEFPKVRHLMTVQPSVTVRANTADVIASVKRVALVAERNTSLRMLIADGSITLEAATGDQAQAVEALEAEVVDVAGGGLAMTAAGFNPHYLSDALAALDAPYVEFSFTAPGKPCLLMGLSEIDGEPMGDYRHVIMLMRLPA